MTIIAFSLCNLFKWSFYASFLEIILILHLKFVLHALVDCYTLILDTPVPPTIVSTDAPDQNDDSAGDRKNDYTREPYQTKVDLLRLFNDTAYTFAAPQKGGVYFGSFYGCAVSGRDSTIRFKSGTTELGRSSIYNFNHHILCYGRNLSWGKIPIFRSIGATVDW